MLDDQVSCRNCGAKISSSDAFCSKCGVRVPQVQEESKQNTVYISKNMMWVIIAFLAVGAILSYATAIAVNSNPNSGSSNHTSNTDSANSQGSSIYTPYKGVFQYCTSSFQTNPSETNSLVVVKLLIKNTGEETYSLDTNDWVLGVNGKNYSPYMSSDLETSDRNKLGYVKPGTYASIVFAYRVDGKIEVGHHVKLIYKGSNSTSDDIVKYTIQSPVDQSTTIGRVATTDTQDSTSTETSMPVTKTLADKETESEESHASEDSDDTEDGSSSNIFDYCTWQAETTKTIGKYNEAPEGESYVVVTIKLDNTGDETYSTNGNYWHLKIGDVYYQYDSATYDNSLNHMTTNVGPGGKITTKIAYLVDGEPSVSDMDLYYDGPGSEGTITS